MKLSELKILVDEWIATDDWDDAEIALFDSDGNSVPSNIEITFECLPDRIDGYEALGFTEV